MYEVGNDLYNNEIEIMSNEFKKKIYIAHIHDEKIQSCKEHSVNTAKYAKADLECIDLGNLGYLAGILHDMGKFTDEFSDYIQRSANGEKVARGSVIHTFAGARTILSKFHSNYGNEQLTGWENLTAELIATAIGSHHGLFDEYDENYESGLDYRVKRQPEYDNRAKEAFFNDCCTEEDINALFVQACEEVSNVVLKLSEVCRDSDSYQKLSFYLGVLQRLLNSAVMDGDRRDTAEFMGDISFSDSIRDGNSELWMKLLSKIIGELDSFSQDTEIQIARRQMSNYCAKFAREHSSDIYRMNLPTGGGKTLCGLRYGVEHANAYGKKRLFFVVPLLSILDQNAGVIRNTVGNDDIILEHHSNIIMDEMSDDESIRHQLLMETWDSPIVITTLVQFLNTLFAGQTSSVRRFESLVNSIIIIDEVQSVPENMISLFNLTINFLKVVCNATVILSSATQPIFEKNKYALLISDKDMIPSDEFAAIEKLFRRTMLEYDGNLDWDELSELAITCYREYKSTLVICNTKSEARKLYALLTEQVDDVIHLSTSMCMNHRKRVIGDMQTRLNNGMEFICISTQLIEAGVDVSFGSVIRIAAGMDSIVQAAGRCNRNGEKEGLAPVHLVFLKGENLKFLKTIKEGQDVTGELISEYNKNPLEYDSDLMSSKAIKFYYKRYFNKLNNIERSTEYVIRDDTLFNLLACNRNRVKDSVKDRIYTMRQAFKTAGEEFSVFDSIQKTVIIPYDEKSKELVVELLSSESLHDINYCRKILRLLKEYTIQLFDYEYSELVKAGGIHLNQDVGVALLDECFYNDSMGVVLNKDSTDKIDEVLIM